MCGWLENHSRDIVGMWSIIFLYYTGGIPRNVLVALKGLKRLKVYSAFDDGCGIPTSVHFHSHLFPLELVYTPILRRVLLFTSAG